MRGGDTFYLSPTYSSLFRSTIDRFFEFDRDQTQKIYQSYYGIVRSMLDSNKKYPLLSLQRRQEGTPVVEFTILGNGDVIDVKITSSGYRLLDREASLSSNL